MRKRFNGFAIVLLAAVLIAGGLNFDEARAAENISVSSIESIYVEKGSQNCLVTLKAQVTNHGDTDDVTVKAVAIDTEGFQLYTVKFSGHIEGGETKVLLERVKMATQTYDQIQDWELKK